MADRASAYHARRTGAYHRRWIDSLVWMASKWLALLAGACVFRVRHNGSVPANLGPLLYLGNHCNVLDPVWVALIARGPIRFMANERLFSKPLIGTWIRHLGAFPKRKFDRDPSALRTAFKTVRDGEALGIFPEGKRSWDGRPCKLVPGVGKLIQRLQVSVVLVRNQTGFLQHPLWARYGRWIPIELDVIGPFSFLRSMDAGAIEAEISRLITIDPERIDLPKWSFGLLLAEGLPEYLWACPQCLRPNALRAVGTRRSHIRCTCCRRVWRVTLSQQLIGKDAGTHTMTVTAAYDRIIAHFGRYRDQLLSNGSDTLLLETPCASLSRKTDAGLQVGHIGTARLYVDRVQIVDEDGTSLWCLRVEEIGACFQQWGGVAIVNANGLLLLQTGEQSAVMWCHFLTLARQHPQAPALGCCASAE